MKREEQIAIMMADGYTKREAEKSLDFGTTIYEDFEDYATMLKENGIYNGETIEDARDGKIADLDVTTYAGKEYFIEIVH